MVVRAYESLPQWPGVGAEQVCLGRCDSPLQDTRPSKATTLARLIGFKLTCQLTFELSVVKKFCWGWKMRFWLHVWLLGVVGEWRRAAVVTLTWGSSKVQRRGGLCGAHWAVGGEESQRGLQIENNWVSTTITLSNGRWQCGWVWAAGPIWEAECSEPSLLRWQCGGWGVLPKRRSGEDNGAEGLGGGRQSNPGLWGGILHEPRQKGSGQGWGVGEWCLVGQRITFRTVFYIFPGTERSWDNRDENKNPGWLMRSKKLTFKFA